MMCLYGDIESASIKCPVLHHLANRAKQRIELGIPIQCARAFSMDVWFWVGMGCLGPRQAVGKYLKRNMESVSGRKLTQCTYDAVVNLCQDEANTVFIVSGLNDKGLMHVS